MSMNNISVFIITNGRPDNVITYNTLRKQGYSGKIYLIVDDEDKEKDNYLKKFGSAVLVFDKQKYIDSADSCNNFETRKTILFARNASFDLAKKLGIKYFMQLDDDYTNFQYKLYEIEKLSAIKNLDKTFSILLNFFIKSKATTIAIAQGGDFIGGKYNKMAQEAFMKRKAMNSFICDSDKPFKFIGAMNDDVNTYVTLGSRGHLFMQIPFFSLTQKQTQSQDGGLTDMYLKYGTYNKSFTTVINMPSAVVVKLMGRKHPRLHHLIYWNKCVPKIVSEEYKK